MFVKLDHIPKDGDKNQNVPTAQIVSEVCFISSSNGRVPRKIVSGEPTHVATFGGCFRVTKKVDLLGKTAVAVKGSFK